MRPADVVRLYRHRGSIMLWKHAMPLDREDLDPVTGGPRLSAGGRRPNKRTEGTLGESFFPPYPVIGYLQSKMTTTFNEVFGLVDDRTMQLTVPSILPADSDNGVRSLPDYLDKAYRAGEFVLHDPGKTVARDRFEFLGVSYVVKSSAVPIIDGNITLAWRMLVAASTL